MTVDPDATPEDLWQEVLDLREQVKERDMALDRVRREIDRVKDVHQSRRFIPSARLQKALGRLA